MFKIFSMGIIVFCVFLTFGITGYADEIKILVDNEQMELEEPALASNGRILIPLRKVTEYMGYKVSWDNDNQVVKIVGTDLNIAMQINNPKIKIIERLSFDPKDTKTYDREIDVPAMLVNGKTYVPLRALSECFGADVNWQGNSQTVEININLVPFTSSDGKYGFSFANGSPIIPAIYEETMSFNEGLGAVKKDGKWGFVDKTNKEIIPSRYEAALTFYTGLAPVKENDKWGAIDKKGSIVIPFQYEYMLGFAKGVAAVSKDGLWSYIDKFNVAISQEQYEDVIYFNGIVSIAKKNSKWGILAIDENKKMTISAPFVYDDVTDFDGKTATVQKNGEVFQVNIKGERI